MLSVGKNSVIIEGMTKEEFLSAISEGVKTQLEELKKNFQPKEPTILLTRDEVADMFSVDISTIHNWTSKGMLKSFGVGRRVYYKRAEVEEAIVELKK